MFSENKPIPRTRIISVLLHNRETFKTASTFSRVIKWLFVLSQGACAEGYNCDETQKAEATIVASVWSQARVSFVGKWLGNKRASAEVENSSTNMPKCLLHTIRRHRTSPNVCFGEWCQLAFERQYVPLRFEDIFATCFDGSFWHVRTFELLKHFTLVSWHFSSTASPWDFPVDFMFTVGNFGKPLENDSASRAGALVNGNDVTSFSQVWGRTCQNCYHPMQMFMPV